MKGFKGTPGPWRVNTIGEHWNNPALVHLEVTFGTDGECICDTVYRREDADLIAAAPELLEALWELVSEYESIVTHEFGSSVLDVDPDYIRAKAAIAKALGESQ